ncbi:hypothetical protein KAR91_31025 [Candidatus Pacearchaeota archaeon]|nr:hypothetical protein [Candidatus Pacearchaeota archaeon]
MNIIDKTIQHRTSTRSRKFAKVSVHYDFVRDRTIKDVFCLVCNKMSEIHQKPRRCRRHLGGVYA